MTASDTRSVYARLFALLLVLLALGACGGGDDDEGGEKVGEAGGLAQFEVESGGFTIGVPEGWETASADDVFDEGTLDRMREETPDLAPYLDALSGEDSVIKFIAFDPENSEDFTTNLNVVVEPTPTGISRDEYFEGSRKTIERILGPTDIEEERVDLPAGEATRLTYVHSMNAEGLELLAIQYLLYEDSTGYTLTYTTLPPQRSAREPEFERSARSFRIT